MKVADLVKLSSETLKSLSEFGIRIDDYKYLSLFSDYEEMVRNGNKISYAVTYLSEKYSISEATVYRVLRRFKATI